MHEMNELNAQLASNVSFVIVVCQVYPDQPGIDHGLITDITTHARELCADLLNGLLLTFNCTLVDVNVVFVRFGFGFPPAHPEFGRALISAYPREEIWKNNIEHMHASPTNP
jgi:hypothetical protein